MAYTFNDENAKVEIESGKAVVIDFWAEWCGPCKRISPIIDELAAEYEGQVLIGKYNVDDYSDLSTDYSIRNIPTILFCIQSSTHNNSMLVLYLLLLLCLIFLAN